MTAEREFVGFLRTPPGPPPWTVENAELVARIEALEAVVRALAQSSPMDHSGEMWHSCSICFVDLPLRPGDHESDCAWRMACEALPPADSEKL